MFDINADYLAFKVEGLEELIHAIISPEALQKAMQAALDEVETQVKANFEKRQNQWGPLARSTQMQRLRQGYNASSPILVRSSTLKNNVANGREVKIEGDEVRGDVYPGDAKPPYGSASIGDYMEQLNSVRDFFSLDEEQFEIVYQKMIDTLVIELGLD